MDYINYLKKYQDIPYHIFYNAIENNRLFHAYLLTGESGTPLLELAKFLSASIILKEPDEKPFDVDSKDAYDRILSNTFGDLIILDAKNNQIKINDIRALEDKFSRTAQEIYGKKIYIINTVENLSIDASNALLKFLEEPLPDTYAFLLTENEFALLPTIKSRVQTIHFSNLDQDILIEKVHSSGLYDPIIELLSFFYNNDETIIQKAGDASVQIIANLAIELLKSINNKRLMMNFIFNDLLKNIKDKISARELFDYLIVFFKEALKYKDSNNTILKSYVNILKDLSNITSLDNSILELMHARSELNFNLNINLLLIHTFRTIFGEIK